MKKLNGKAKAKARKMKQIEAAKAEAKAKKAKEIHVLPIEDNSVYKGKTIYQYMTANYIKNAIISGSVFDIHLRKHVAITVVVSNSLDEDAVRNIGNETWKLNGQLFPSAERVFIWLPLNDILEQTFSGTGPLTMGNETGYSGNFLSRVIDMIGIKDVYKKLLADAYNNNSGFSTAIDNLNPEYGKILTA